MISEVSTVEWILAGVVAAGVLALTLFFTAPFFDPFKRGRGKK